MSDAYFAVEEIWNRTHDLEEKILILLAKDEIELRKDDGELIQINISKPTSINDAFVIGLRYEKRKKECGTHTEDTFICRRDALKIEPCYGRDIEKKLPEYKDTHKQQVFTLCQKPEVDEIITAVNTISLNKGGLPEQKE